MPIITIHTAKAGQGATVTAAALATLCATTGQRTLLIDAATGDLPAVLGIPEPDGPGLAEYLTDLKLPSLDTLAVHVTDRLDLLHAGIGGTGPLDLSIIPGGCDRYDTVIIDAGTRPVSGCNADATLLVTRPCYLAIRRAINAANAATGVVLINEPGRSLSAADIEAVLGRRVVATIPYDPAIARAVDAGLLATRLPTILARGLRHVVPSLTAGRAR